MTSCHEPKEELHTCSCSCAEELATLQKQLSKSERQVEKLSSYNEDLRIQIKSLSEELHKYKTVKRVDIDIQVDKTDLLNYTSGEVVLPHWGKTDDVSCQPSSIPISTATQRCDETSEDTTSIQPSVAEPELSIADSLKATAEAAMQQTGFVYDDNTGMHYDYNSGYYYDSEKSLYYDPNAGTYFYYDHETNEYHFHSQVDLSCYSWQHQTHSNQGEELMAAKQKGEVTSALSTMSQGKKHKEKKKKKEKKNVKLKPGEADGKNRRQRRQEMREKLADRKERAKRKMEKKKNKSRKEDKSDSCDKKKRSHKHKKHRKHKRDKDRMRDSVDKRDKDRMRDSVDKRDKDGMRDSVVELDTKERDSLATDAQVNGAADTRDIDIHIDRKTMKSSQQYSKGCADCSCKCHNDKEYEDKENTCQCNKQNKRNTLVMYSDDDSSPESVLMTSAQDIHSDRIDCPDTIENSDEDNILDGDRNRKTDADSAKTSSDLSVDSKQSAESCEHSASKSSVSILQLDQRDSHVEPVIIEKMEISESVVKLEQPDNNQTTEQVHNSSQCLHPEQAGSEALSGAIGLISSSSSSSSEEEEEEEEGSDMESGELTESDSYSDSDSTDTDSDSDSSEEEEEEDMEIMDEELSAKWPPCVRAIVTESDSLEVGSLFIVTYMGGTVGRENKSHVISVPDINVSKVHAKIEYSEEQGEYLIHDLGSQNGTFVNDTKLRQGRAGSGPVLLRHEDMMQIGATKILCHIHTGTDTCDACEPGIVMAEYHAKHSAPKEILILSKEEKIQQQRQQLKQIKQKYGLKNAAYEDNILAIKNPNYEDKSEIRRKTKGSDNPHQKAEVPASVHRPISTGNIGHQLLKKMGWSEGESLGKGNAGIQEPVMATFRSSQTAGLGSSLSGGYTLDDAQTVDLRKAQRRAQIQKRFEQVSSPANTTAEATGDTIASGPKKRSSGKQHPVWTKGETQFPEDGS